MANNYYLGRDPEDVLGASTQYFYAMRRNEDGELFFVRTDLLKDADAIVEVNEPGAPSDTFEDFEEGIDYFEGIRADHEAEYANMKYPQYRWDERSIFYYIDDEGRLVQRINRGYSYDNGVSGP
jgi:hypothetical protein